MSKFDGFLKKMKMVSDDEYDEYDEYDEDEEETDEYDDDEYEEEEAPKKKGGFFSRISKTSTKDDDFDDYDDDDDDSAYSAPVQKAAQPSKNNVYGLKTGSKNQSPEVCMIMPKSYDDANTIADMLLKHKAVVLNLEGIDMAAAQRLIDFASGSCYTVGGSLQKISKKIFIVAPQGVNLSGDFAENMMGEQVDLNSVNMMK